MTNVRRPIYLQFAAVATCSPKALSPTGDALPSQILPHLFVGSQEQTNRDTLNRLNISYILSLGLLPLISSSGISPTSPTGQQQQSSLLPSQNSSRDFKIRLRSATTTPSYTVAGGGGGFNSGINIGSGLGGNDSLDNYHRDENKGVKAVRSIHCKCINIADNSEQNIAKFFDEAHQFIDEARRKKCNILVHCLAGISRSPTIAIAYLMRVNSLRLQDAYNLVKQCRPQIDPNLSFMGELMYYEKSLEGTRTSTTATTPTNIGGNKQLSQTNTYTSTPTIVSNHIHSNHHNQQQQTATSVVANTDSNSRFA